MQARNGERLEEGAVTGPRDSLGSQSFLRCHARHRDGENQKSLIAVARACSPGGSHLLPKEYMGKQLHRKSPRGPVNRERRGLMGGVVEFFDLNPLFHLRRILLRRRHHRGGAASGIKYLKVKDDDLLAGKQHVFPDGQLQEETKLAEDKVGVYDESEGVSASSKKLTRTLSIHHLECDDYVIESGDNGSHEQSEATGSSRKANAFRENDREADDNFSEHQKRAQKSCSEILAPNHTKDPFGAQELYDASKEIFRKILQDEDHISEYHDQRFQNPDSALVLTKSGSFPRIDSSRNSMSSSKLKQILDDTSPSLRQENKSQSSNLKLPLESHNGILGTDSRSMDDDMPSDISNFSSVSLLNLKTQRIDSMDKESKKEKYRISMDSVLHKLPYGQKVPQTMRMEKKGITDRLSPYLKKSRSLTESMERYSLLLDSNFSKESNNHAFQRSKSVHEADPFPAMSHSRTVGHINSLHEFEPYFSRKDGLGDTSHLVYSSKSLTLNSKRIDSSKEIVVVHEGDALSVVNAEKERERSDVVDGQDLEHASENDVLPTYIGEEPMISCAKSSDNEEFECSKASKFGNGCESLQDQEIRPKHCYNGKETNLNPVSDVKPQLQEELINAENYLLPKENIEKIVERIASEELQSSGNLETQEINSRLRTISSAYDSICVKIDGKDEAEFNFVSELLSKSGFSGSELSKAWNSAEQPVDFSLFEEVEGSKCLLDFGLYAPDINLDHLLLFDLINEVILETYPSALKPWLSCFSSGVQRLSEGSRILEEVWAKIYWHRSYQSHPNPSLDYVVDRDLSKNDGWMDIRYETEYLGQEVADLILDDLLVEAISQRQTSLLVPKKFIY